MGSLVGNDGDEHTVTEYIDEHLSSHENIGKQAAERMSGYGASTSEKAAERFAASHQGAIDFSSQMEKNQPRSCWIIIH